MDGPRLPASPSAPRPRTRGDLAALLPVAVYLLVRGVSVAVLAWMASRNGSTTPLAESLAEWDGRWYLGIADGGYDGPPPDLTDANGMRDDTTSLGFLPGYPALVAVVGVLPGLGLLGAALGVSLVAGGVAAMGIARMGTLVTGSRRAGLLLVALFAGSPLALSLSMAYTEALFSALAAWALVGVLERRWLLAGLCTASAGLVRSTAAALIVAVCLAALVEWWGRRDDRRPLGAVLLAPLGLLGWLGWVASRTDGLDGWFELRARGWNDGTSAAPDMGRHVLDVVTGRNTVLFDVGGVATLLGSAVLLVICARRTPWPLVVYAGTLIASVALTVGFANGLPRLLLPAGFVLLIPVADALRHLEPPTQIAVTATIVLSGAWFGAYALAVYPFAI